jgi:hypothetical protein
MGRYTIRIDKLANKHLAKLYKSGNKADIKKVETIILTVQKSVSSIVSGINQFILTYQHKLLDYLSSKVQQSQKHF